MRIHTRDTGKVYLRGRSRIYSSALVVNAYRRMGHGATLTSAYTARLFILAAVMYVDDTDLLYWAPSPTTTTAELVDQVQAATTDWGMLAQATGGALKPGKCFLYLLHYNFEKGRAKMKTLRQLPHSLTHVVSATGPP